jgi:thymidine kinase
MFSGKTEALLRLVRRADIQSKNVMLFRPDVDTRTNYVQSRSGVAYHSHTVSRGSRSILDIAIAGMLDFVAIDEGQFFDEGLVDVVAELANDYQMHVLVSGLDRDFLGRGFGPMADLLVIADEVDKLSAVCVVCRKDASMTQRLIDGKPATPSSPLVLVGGMGDDRYEARCRTHHEIGES